MHWGRTYPPSSMVIPAGRRSYKRINVQVRSQKLRTLMHLTSVEQVELITMITIPPIHIHTTLSSHFIFLPCVSQPPHVQKSRVSEGLFASQQLQAFQQGGKTVR